MSKAFTKGDKVTVLASWDNKGTVTYRDAVVYSCGKKQMVLTDELTGKEIGRHFAPVLGSLDNVGSFNWGGTFPRMSEAEAVEQCLKAGALIVEAVKVHLADVRERYGDGAGPHYLAHLDSELAALHEPRALRRP